MSYQASASEASRRRLHDEPAHQIQCPGCPALGPPAATLTGAIRKAKAHGWNFDGDCPVACPDCHPPRGRKR